MILPIFSTALYSSSQFMFFVACLKALQSREDISQGLYFVIDFLITFHFQGGIPHCYKNVSSFISTASIHHFSLDETYIKLTKKSWTNLRRCCFHLFVLKFHTNIFSAKGQTITACRETNTN